MSNPTKADLEEENKALKARVASLEEQLDGLGNSQESQSGALLSQEDMGYVEPLLLGACIGALRNPISGVAYSETEFNAYAPDFIDQAVRMHNMALARLAASKG